MTLHNLPHTDGRRIEVAGFCSVSQAMKRLTKKLAITTDGEHGAINAWYGDDGMWHAQRWAFYSLKSECSSTRKIEIRHWIKENLEKIN